jgi:hypothetical protein
LSALPGLANNSTIFCLPCQGNENFRRIFRHADCIGKNIAVFFVMLAAPAKISQHFPSCWLHRQKCASIFRHAGCTGKNAAAFSVMLAAPAKMRQHFPSCWLHRQKCASIFRHAGCTGKNVATFLPMLPGEALTRH